MTGDMVTVSWRVQVPVKNGYLQEVTLTGSSLSVVLALAQQVRRTLLDSQPDGANGSDVQGGEPWPG